MQRCVARLEIGTPCGMPSIVFDTELGGPVCIAHAPHHFHRGDRVRVHSYGLDGRLLPEFGEEGVVLSLFETPCYEVDIKGQRVLYYDWELSPATQRCS